MSPFAIEDLRCVGEGALGTASPYVHSPCAPPLRCARRLFASLRAAPAFARYPSLLGLQARPLRFSQVASPFLLLPTRSCSPSATVKGGVPNSSPSRPRLLLGAAEASTIMRAKPRPLSATPRTFARERLRFLQCQKKQQGFFFEVEASSLCVKTRMPLNLTVGWLPCAVI